MTDPIPEQAPFRTCGSCHQAWKSWSDFVLDGRLRLLGLQAFPTVVAATEATGRFDIVDVFRRPELCLPHAQDAVAAGAGCLWLQLGVVSWEAARLADEAGLAVVMDRCTAIEVARVRRRA